MNERTHPRTIELVELCGEGLTVEQVVAVARHGARVALTDAARRRIACCRVMVEELLERGEKVYGLTTGFGKLRDISIPNKDVQRLQLNLIRSHSAGVGRPFDEEVVRAALVLRANTLCRGNSGIRVEVVEAVVALLNDGIVPMVPEQGSVGASGDLAPLSHLSLVLVGDPEGRILPNANRPAEGLARDLRASEFVRCGSIPWAEAARTSSPTFQPVRLEAKEGLALNNGTQFMTAIAALALFDAEVGLAWSELAAAMSLEALKGVRHAFAPELHKARDLSFQAQTAASILGHAGGSQILDLLLNTAQIRRARTSLREADELLRDLHVLDPTQAAKIAALRDRIQAVMRGLSAYLDPEQGPPTEVLELAGQPPRTQIEAFGRLLIPIRRQATDVLQAFDDPGLPIASIARESVVRALNCLGHAVPAAPPVQDDYSLRCTPQVVACAHRAIAHAREVVEVEINSATDNPLLFPPEPPEGFQNTDPATYAAWLKQPERAERLAERVLGGGNFHGEPVGKVMDYFALAVAEVGSIAERRLSHLVDETASNGLPPFLMESSGLNSGFMIPQYTAASLVSENKSLCHPATVDSIPTCANSEDHVSMGTIAARQARQVLNNVLYVISIEVLAALQGLTFRVPLKPGGGVQTAIDFLRERGYAPYVDDRVMHPEIEGVRELLRDYPPTHLLRA